MELTRLIDAYIKYACNFFFPIEEKEGKEELGAELNRSLCAGGFAAVILTHRISKTKMDLRAVLIEQVVMVCLLVMIYFL
jgi:hypothetical protein